MRFLISILLLAAFAPIQAQLRYGLRLGGDFANARLKNGFGASMKNSSGFSGGLMMEYQLPYCGLAPDIAILYSRRNTKVMEQVDGGESILRSYGRNFLEIPIHLKYKIYFNRELFGIMAYTGPSIAIRLDKQDERFPTKRCQPGWDLGIGFDIVNFIQITGGYRFGLGNALRKDNPYRQLDSTLHTNGWNISANLLFDF